MKIWNNLLKIKKYNYRIKARNYTIENITLFFTGLAGKKKTCKTKGAFFKWKKNNLLNAHDNNGHLGINRTIAKIKEKWFLWETLVEDVKNFIDNYSKCIIAKKGKKIINNLKTIITKAHLNV